jgi:hypothetical protein
MSGVLNDCDALLQGATVRILNPKDAFINLTPSGPGFHKTGAGVVDIATVTVTADLIALDGDVTFSVQGGTMSNVAARSVDVNFTTGTAILTATVVTNGETFARSCVIPLLRDGANGQPAYTWVKYADSAAGAGLSDDPTGKSYIGFAYNKSTATESTTAADYTWSLIKGTDGQPGGKGADGQTLYTWIKYSDNADGTGLYDLPTASTQYLGIAVNKTTATESTVKTDYVWSKFRGADGVGTAGAAGARGAGHYYVAGSSWSDIAAQAACPGGPVVNDVVTISSSTFVMEKRWTGSAWVENGVVIDGKAIFPNSILASSIDTRGLSVRSPDGSIIIDAGRTLAEQTRSNPNLVPAPRSWFFNNASGNRNGDARFGDGQYITLNVVNAGGYAGADSPPLGIPANATYTVSFDAFIQGGTTTSRALSADIYNGNNIDTVGSYTVLTVAGGMVRVRFTETMPNVTNAAGAWLRVFSGGGSDNYIVISNIKVELGNTVTGWEDSIITADNSAGRVMPNAITNTQFGGDLWGSLWNGIVGPGGAGWLLQRNGSIYLNDANLRGSVMGGDYAGYLWVSGKRADNSWKRGYFLGEAGLLMGNPDSGSYFQIEANGNIWSKNFTIVNGVPTFTSPVINNPVYASFGVSAGGSWNASGRFGNVNFGNRTATFTGADNLKSVAWSIEFDSRYGNFYLTGQNTATVGVSYSGPSPGSSAQLTVTVIGKDGRIVTDTIDVDATITN